MNRPRARNCPVWRSEREDPGGSGRLRLFRFRSRRSAFSCFSSFGSKTASFRPYSRRSCLRRTGIRPRSDLPSSHSVSAAEWLPGLSEENSKSAVTPSLVTGRQSHTAQAQRRAPHYRGSCGESLRLEIRSKKKKKQTSPAQLYLRRDPSTTCLCHK